jgi:hypothetical protein
VLPRTKEGSVAPVRTGQDRRRTREKPGRRSLEGERGAQLDSEAIVLPRKVRARTLMGACSQRDRDSHLCYHARLRVCRCIWRGRRPTPFCAHGHPKRAGTAGERTPVSSGIMRPLQVGAGKGLGHRSGAKRRGHAKGEEKRGPKGKIKAGAFGLRSLKVLLL